MQLYLNLIKFDENVNWFQKYNILSFKVFLPFTQTGIKGIKTLFQLFLWSCLLYI